jgi:hypothetical protein
MKSNSDFRRNLDSIQDELFPYTKKQGNVKIINKREYTHLKNKVGVINYAKSHAEVSPNIGDRLRTLIASGFEVLYDLLKEEFYAIKLSENRNEVLYSFSSPDFFDLYNLAVSDENEI